MAEDSGDETAAVLPITDGVVTLRTMRTGDRDGLLAGRDEVARRFLGEGDPDPRPVAVVEVGGAVVGWVDVDDRAWLEPHECNVGYLVFPEHRGKGFASRAVQLLLQLLASEGRYSVATLLIDRENEPSLGLARRLGYPRVPDLDGHPFFKVAVPSLEPSDGVVRLRRHDPADVQIDLEGQGRGADPLALPPGSAGAVGSAQP